MTIAHIINLAVNCDALHFVGQGLQSFFFRHWSSQSFVKNAPAGNLLLSASILYTGVSATKVLRVLTHLRCQSIHMNTYLEHQKLYLWPTIKKVWSVHQEELLSQIKADGGKVVVGGDGTYDRLGHCVKYCSYTLMELNRNKILEINLVQGESLVYWSSLQSINCGKEV